ncbi:MAG: class I SAM-dependent methyltransferase [Blastocatellia bacterium]
MTDSEPKDFYCQALRYDLVMGAYATEEMLGFYRRQIARFGEPALELACGSGRLLIPLTKAGIDVTGLDISAPMLHLAEIKAAEQGVKLSLVQGDVRNFELGRKFNTILFPAQSMQHLLTLADVEAGLAGVRRHLANEGRLVIEIFNPSVSLLSRAGAQRYLVGQYQQPASKSKITVTEQVSYDAASQINHIEWFYLDETSGVEETLSFAMRQFYPQEVDALLSYNGFVIEHKYGNYQAAAFSSSAGKQLLVCRLAG